MKKKILCQILTMALAFSLFSGEAFAASASVTTENTSTEISADTSVETEEKDDTVQSETTADDLEDESETVKEETAQEETGAAEEETVQEETDAVKDETVQEESEAAEEETVQEESEAVEEETESEEDTAVLEDEYTAPVMMTTLSDVSTAAVEEVTYSYNYIYTSPNDNATLSPADVNASQVVELAFPIIVQNEGKYYTVTEDDNGAVSIGKIQWHGNRALYLLRETIETNPTTSKTLLGDTLYTEITSSSTNWSSRILTSDEGDTIEGFLKNMSQAEAVQNKMAKADIAVYVNHGIALGITNVPALVYYADLENQGGSGRSKECAAAAVSNNLCSSYGKLTLNELYIASINNSVMGKSIYMSRRARVYKACTELGYTYCSSADSQIPCAFSSFTDANYLGEAWLQWALNTYTGTSLTITGQYDTALTNAIKSFQKSNGLTADGLAGINTIKALVDIIVDAKNYPPSTVTKEAAVISTAKEKWTVSSNAGSFSLGAKSNHSEAALAYKSSNTKVATVSSAGVVTIVGTGNATITISQAATDNYLAAEKTVTIVTCSNPVITVTKTSWSLNDNASSFSVGAKSNHSQSGLTYKSSNTKVATVSSAGVVTIVGAGTANITVSQAASTNYYAASKTVKLTVYSTNPSSYKVPTTTLRAGKSMTKSNVQWFQASMNKLNDAGLLVDGTWGSDETAAAKAFQKKAGLTVDGIVGSGTRTVITKMLSVVNSTQTITVSSSTKGVTVKWKKNSKAVGYKVYRKAAGGSWKCIKTISKNSTVSYTDKSGTAGTKYSYRVRSYYKSGSMTKYGKYSSSLTGTKKKTSGTVTYSVPTTTLKKGSTGDGVKWMQSGLNKVMNAGLTVDGQFGSGTEKAVKKFQKKYGLTADGIFGKASRTKLQSLLN